MNLNDLSRNIDRMNDRVAHLRSTSIPNGNPFSQSMDALEETLEELQIAREELARLGDQLIVSQETVESERSRFHNLFNLAPVGYVVTDGFGVVREANHAALEMLNIRLHHLVGKPLACFFPGEAKPALRAELHRLATADRLVGFESRIEPRGFPPIHVSLSATVARNFQGKLETIRWILHDISQIIEAGDQIRTLNTQLEDRVQERTSELREQIRLQEELLIATHHSVEVGLNDLVEGLDAIIWRANAETGVISFVSHYAEELLGYPTESWLTNPNFPSTIIHPQDREWAAMERLRLVGGVGSSETEYRIIAADGRIYWFRESVRLRQTTPHGPGELHGLMINITRRKLVEQQLYASKRSLSDEVADLRHLHVLFGRLSPTAELEPLTQEILTSVVAVLDAEAAALYLRDAELNSWHLSAAREWPNRLSGENASAPVGPTTIGPLLTLTEPTYFTDIQDVPGQVELPANLRENGFRAAIVLPLPSRSDGLLGCVMALFKAARTPANRSTQLAERYTQKAAEFIETAYLLRKVREANRRKDEALATLGHELRTPLSAVLHAAEILGLPNETFDQDILKTLEHQARHAACLIDDLLDTCRLRGGQASIRKLPTEVTTVAKNAATAVRPLIEARQLQLNLNLPSDPLWVEGDPSRLEQIVVNLITNAANFSEAREAIHLTVSSEANDILIRIRDTGAGISPEVLPQIFDLFAQAEPSRGGMGIGLALVKSLTELHGGEVSAASDGLGQGSEFVIRLPRLPNVDDPLPTSSTPEAAHKRPHEGMRVRILLVEDHEDSARLVARILRSAGHEVHVAADGPTAIDEAKSFLPDLILLDLGLPGMSGGDVARELRANPTFDQVRIIAITGRGDEEAIRLAREAGCNDYLIKPVDTKHLFQILETKSILSQ